MLLYIRFIYLYYWKCETVKKLLVIGRGQYSYVVEEIAKNFFDSVDFLDDNSSKDNGVIGKIQDYVNFTNEYEYAIVSIGNPEVRLDLTNKLENAGYKIPTLISEKSYVSKTAKICDGCIVEPMAVINPNTVIAKCSLISAGAVVNHNSTVKSGCHIDCGAVVASNTTVEEKTKVPNGTVYKA